MIYIFIIIGILNINKISKEIKNYLNLIGYWINLQLIILYKFPNFFQIK